MPRRTADPFRRACLAAAVRDIERAAHVAARAHGTADAGDAMQSLAVATVDALRRLLGPAAPAGAVLLTTALRGLADGPDAARRN